MFAHVRVIGRRLERDVERDLEALPARRRDEPLEVLDRAEPRLDGGVSSLVRSDRPRTAGFPRLRRQRIIASFAGAPADRMNRRQVQHVESHRRDVRQARGRFVERRAARRVGARRSREHLVPRAIARALAFHGHAQRPFVSGRGAAVRGPRHRLHELFAERLGDAFLLWTVGGERVRRAGEDPIAAGRAADHRRAFEQLARDVLSRAELLRERLPPALESIDPPFDRVLVVHERVDAERRRPAVVAERRHRRLAPAILACTAREQRGREHVVAVGEDVRFDLDAFPDGALDWKPSAVDLRRHPFDHDATEPVWVQRLVGVTHGDARLRPDRPVRGGALLPSAFCLRSLVRLPSSFFLLLHSAPCGPQSAARRRSSRRLLSRITAIDCPCSS